MWFGGLLYKIIGNTYSREMIIMQKLKCDLVGIIQNHW